MTSRHTDRPRNPPSANESKAPPKGRHKGWVRRLLEVDTRSEKERQMDTLRFCAELGSEGDKSWGTWENGEVAKILRNAVDEEVAEQALGLLLERSYPDRDVVDGLLQYQMRDRGEGGRRALFKAIEHFNRLQSGEQERYLQDVARQTQGLPVHLEDDVEGRLANRTISEFCDHVQGDLPVDDTGYDMVESVRTIAEHFRRVRKENPDITWERTAGMLEAWIDEVETNRAEVAERRRVERQRRFDESAIGTMWNGAKRIAHERKKARQLQSLEVLEQRERLNRKETREAAGILVSGENKEITERAASLFLEKETRATALAVYALISYAIQIDDEKAQRALNMANDLFGGLSSRQQASAMKKVQKELVVYTSEPFEDDEDAHAVRVMADFYSEAADCIPTNGLGDKKTEPHELTIRALRRAVEYERTDDVTTPQHIQTRNACTRALWELEYADFDFWEARLIDPVTRNLTIRQLLSMEPAGKVEGVADAVKRRVGGKDLPNVPAEEITEEDGAHLLKLHIAEVGPDVARSDSGRKLDFFRTMLRDRNDYAVQHTLAAIGHLPEIPEDFYERAGDRLGVGTTEVKQAAMAFLLSRNRHDILAPQLPALIEFGGPILQEQVFGLLSNGIREQIAEEHWPGILNALGGLASRDQGEISARARGTILTLVNAGNQHAMNYLNESLDGTDATAVVNTLSIISHMREVPANLQDKVAGKLGDRDRNVRNAAIMLLLNDRQYDRLAPGITSHIIHAAPIVQQRLMNALTNDLGERMTPDQWDGISEVVGSLVNIENPSAGVARRTLVKMAKRQRAGATGELIAMVDYADDRQIFAGHELINLYRNGRHELRETLEHTCGEMVDLMTNGGEKTPREKLEEQGNAALVVARLLDLDIRPEGLDARRELETVVRRTVRASANEELQFSATHTLTNLYVVGREDLRPTLEEVGERMTVIAQEPIPNDQGEQAMLRQVMRAGQARMVLTRLQEAGILPEDFEMPSPAATRTTEDLTVVNIAEAPPQLGEPWAEGLDATAAPLEVDQVLSIRYDPDNDEAESNDNDND